MFIERGKINDADEQKGRKKEYINSALSMLAFYILLFLLSACGSDVNISSGTNTSIPSAPPGFLPAASLYLSVAL